MFLRVKSAPISLEKVNNPFGFDRFPAHSTHTCWLSGGSNVDYAIGKGEPAEIMPFGTLEKGGLLKWRRLLLERIK